MKITIKHRESQIIRCVKLFLIQLNNDVNFEYFSHDNTDESESIILTVNIPENELYTVIYKGKTLKLYLKSLNEYICIDGFIDNYKELSVEGENAETFLKDSIEYYNTLYITKLKEDKLNILHFRYGQFWEIDSHCAKRSMDTVYLPKKSKTSLINDVTKFINNKSKYESLNIPYSRIYMLYGPPGTGKTSLAKSIASEFNKNVAVLDFDKDMGDKELKQAFKCLPKNSIVLLEDIDCLFDSRKACDEFKNDVSFSAILNTLDGICEQNGLIMFLTSNHLDKLDPALVRRIDYFVKFDYATKEQIKGIYDKFYPEFKNSFEEFYNKTKHVKMTINVLQKFFTRHLDENIVEKSDELCEFASGELCLENLNNTKMYL
jgi:Cdc6-like AAA superfamily ATPase